ncbi:MAG: DUF1460 domain-containing protein [Bacteroidales bacterium]|nr:DUF1460 domain-containing protein [Bacteroidales bacterium]
MKRIFFASIVIFLAFFSSSVRLGAVEGENVVFPEQDRTVARKVLTLLHKEKQKAAEEGRNLTSSDLVVMAARQLLGTPYVASTLDSDWKGEELRIFLTETDCILFVESCLNLALTVSQMKEPSEESLDMFVSRMAGTRYRTPGPEWSYSDRVHYTTEWIRRQEGVTLKDMTMDLGGKVIDNPVRFMSSHPDSYPQLSDKSVNPSLSKDLDAIRKVEDRINQEPLTAILTEDIPEAIKEIRSGDIICFVTSVEGLDIAHVAIAFIYEGRVGFIHASSKEKKVVTDAKTIFEYVSASHNLSGIKVVRPL